MASALPALPATSATEVEAPINVAIVGVGNCASALVQGVHYYTKHSSKLMGSGISFPLIGGYAPSCIRFVAGFDVDVRKIGKPINTAIFEKPNCCYVIDDTVAASTDCGIVHPAPIMDGVAPHMLSMPEDRTFKPFDPATTTVMSKAEIVALLQSEKVDVLINYLPVGSQAATEYWAEICLDASIPFMNCIPVFIASNPVWEEKFKAAGLPLVGDDMKSQFGASILSQALQELAFDRGHKVKAHIQQNSGGNTDFANMLDRSRLASKKISKENVIRSQNIIRGVSEEGSCLYAGPSDYVPFFGDNKIANLHLELEGFGGAPVILDARLSVQDSPNSAGVVIDAIRFLKVAREMGITGSLRGASAFTQKTPPQQMTMRAAMEECQALAERRTTAFTSGASAAAAGTTGTATTAAPASSPTTTTTAAAPASDAPAAAGGA